MRFVGAIIVGFSVFLGSMLAMTNSPTLGVLVGVAGGIIAGMGLCNEVNHR